MGGAERVASRSLPRECVPPFLDLGSSGTSHILHFEFRKSHKSSSTRGTVIAAPVLFKHFFSGKKKGKDGLLYDIQILMALFEVTGLSGETLVQLFDSQTTVTRISAPTRPSADMGDVY